MKKYRYDGDKVIELATKFVLKVCKTRDEAKNLVKKLNSGSGFAGDTPNFFVYKKDQECLKK